MKRFPFLMLILGVYPLITAQVPFEYFELSTLEPPQTQAVNDFIETPLMPSELFLDRHTQTAGDLTLSEPFAPPVGNHIRRLVYSQIQLKDDERRVYIVPDASLCEPWEIKTVPNDYTLHRSALVYREIDGIHTIDIPSDSPEMQVTSFHVFNENNESVENVKLLKCPGDTYSVIAPEIGKYRFEYETVSLSGASEPRSAEFFKGKMCTPARKESHEVETFLKELVKNEPALVEISHQKDVIYELVRYFQSYASESLSDVEVENGVSRTLIGQMLREKKGLCRHRAILMVLAARAMGCSARITANEIHAFVEIEMQGRWYPVELGGNARSLTIQPTSPHLASRISKDYSFLDQPEEISDKNMAGVRESSVNHGDPDNRNASNPNLMHQKIAPEDDIKALKNLEIENEKGFDIPSDSVHHSEVQFISSVRPNSMTRDVAYEISGILADENGQLLSNQNFELKLSNHGRTKIQQVQTDSEGKCQIWIRLPADWPLGPTEMNWYILQ